MEQETGEQETGEQETGEQETGEQETGTVYPALEVPGYCCIKVLRD